MGIESLENRILSCAFTGHRSLESDFSYTAFKKLLKKLISNGVRIFYVGMAMGFDMLAAEEVLNLKKKGKDVKLIACIPCENQQKYYSPEDQERYLEILEKADEKVYVSKSYTFWCMQKRNEYMVDRCDVLIAYINRETGGTANTVRYAKRKYPEKEIIYV